MNRLTEQKLDSEARQAILNGVNKVFEPVRRTLGPAGNNALIYGVYGRSHRLLNDGYTIAEVIEPKDEFENLAAKAFKDAAKKTNEKAGDGTTTTVVIAGKLINNIFNQLLAASSMIGEGTKQNVMELKRTLFASAKYVIEEIKKVAKKVETLEELEKISVVSTEDVELGKTIANMAWEVGEYGFIDIVEGHKGQIETEIIKGARFPAKIVAKGFVNDAAKFRMVAEDVEVILTNWKLDNVGQVADFLNPILKKHPKVAILAPDFSKEVVEDLFKACYQLVPDGKGGAMKQKSNIDIFPVKVPSLRTEQFEDIAIYTGARFINKDQGDKLYSFKESDLGFLGKLVVKDSEIREDAIATGGKGTQTLVGLNPITKDSYTLETPVLERIKTLKQQVEESKEEADKNLLRRRIASLSSAVGIIRVGATSESELYYLKKKIEDGVYACKGALEEGYVKGGGLCLKEIAETLSEDDPLRHALIAPYEQIQENAEGEFEIGDEIIDPVKVVRLSVEHAVSAAGNLITCKMIIPEVREKSPAEGYEDIARSILIYARLYAKEQGLTRENLEEIERDNKARDDMMIRATVD